MIEGHRRYSYDLLHIKKKGNQIQGGKGQQEV